MKRTAKTLLSVTIMATTLLALTACGGGGGGSTPSGGAAITSSIANDHLTVQSAVTKTNSHSLKDPNPVSTTVSFNATGLTSDVTVTVNDAGSFGNSLMLDGESGSATCKLTPSAPSCHITVTAVAGDNTTAPNNTDALTYAVSDSSVSISPSSNTITFTKSSTTSGSITAKPDTNQLAVPSTSTAPSHNLKVAPISTELTFTETNLSDPVTITVTDQNTDGNSLALDGKTGSDTCTITPSTSPTCSITVATTTADKVGGQDELTFTTSSGMVVNPPAELFQFVSQASATPTIDVTPTALTINHHQTTSFAIQGNGFASNQSTKVTYTLSTDSGTNPVAQITAKGTQTSSGTCEVSKANNFQCNVQIAGVNVGTATLTTAFSDGTTATVDDPAVTVTVRDKKAATLTYAFDATMVGGTDNAATSIAHITSLGKVDYTASKYFSIDNTTGTLNITPGLPAGVYQINVKATNADGNVAYNTFYVEVNSTLSYTNWLAGKMTAYNVNNVGGQPLTMLYSYSHYAPYTQKPSTEAANFIHDYTEYGSDVASINSTYLSTKAPISVLTAEFGGPAYQPVPIGSDNAAPSYWTVTSDADIKDQVIKSADIMDNGFTNLDWIPQWIQVSGVTSTNPIFTVSPDLTFGNYVRADYATYDPDQMKILTDTLMKYATCNQAMVTAKTCTAVGETIPGITGINLDLEKGTANVNAAPFKAFADNLAYRGLFFGYYEFADKSFQPSIINAMGPLGIAFVSAYDVGSTRDSESNYNQTVSGLGSFLYGDIYPNSVSCGAPTKDANVFGRDSWCNLSINDSLYSNTQAWTTKDENTKTSTQDNMDLFNGNFSVTLPVGESSTDFTYLELIHPDFAALLTSQAGLAVTNNTAGSACGVLAQNHDASNYNKDNISNCLLQAKTFSYAGKSYTFGQFKPCLKKDGTAMSYKDCILISANLSGTTSAEGILGDDTNAPSPAEAVGYPSQADYMRANLKAYEATNPHLVGYSLFALQNAASGPGGTYSIDNTVNPKVNDAIQEPWTIAGDVLTKGENCIYIDGDYNGDCDPFYYSKQDGLDPVALVKRAWTEFGTLDLARK